jgi:DNA-binding transcriptional LysR family regulator
MGFVGSTTHGALQRIVRLFRAECPAVELVLKEGTSHHIMQLVESGELDVGLVRTPLMAPSQAVLTPLLSERFVAALPTGHALADQPELRLEELSRASFVFYARLDAAGLHAMAMLACQLAGFLPRVTQEATQVQTVLSLVESGLGVALVPSIVQHVPNPHIAYRCLADLPEAVNIGLAMALHKERSSVAATRLREVAARAFAMAGSRWVDGQTGRL